MSVYFEQFGEPVPPDPAILRATFGLTPREAQVASFICRGWLLRDAAREIGHSYATAHYQLKSILEKTDTSRQHELTALLLQMERIDGRHLRNLCGTIEGRYDCSLAR